MRLGFSLGSSGCNGKSAEVLVREYRTVIFLANAFFLGGLLTGIGLYRTDFFVREDWRGIALGAGGGSTFALIALGLGAAARGHYFKEAYVAYAISQKTPVAFVYGVLLLCSVSFVVALASLVEPLSSPDNKLKRESHSGGCESTRSAGGNPSFAPAGQGFANGAASTVSSLDNLAAQPDSEQK